MSTSPTQHISAADRRDNHEHMANGFTAVNGRISPPSSAPRQIHNEPEPRVNGDHSNKSKLSQQYGEDRHASNTSGPDKRPPRLNHVDPQRTPSPASLALKRRRSGSPAAPDRYNGDSTAGDNGRRVEFEEQRNRPHTYPHEASAPRERNIPWRPPHETLDEPETRLREALQNGVDEMNGAQHGDHGYDDDRAGPSDMSPENEDDWITSKAGVKVNPGKRKRAFTNRTKTGCQTCRRRKKKCDEQKPTCQNCQRGGFMCEGYTQQKVFAKATPPAKVPPMAIQAKDAFNETGVHYPRPDARTSMTFAGIPQNQPPRHYEDEVHDSGRSYSSTPYDNHRGYVSREPSHGMNGINHTPSPYPAHQHMQLQAQRALSYPSPAPTGPSHTPSSNTPTSRGPSLQQQHHQPQQQPHSAKKAEKEKMIHGEDYSPLDQQLIQERENCRRLLETYNTSFVSSEERQRQLRAILEPESQNQGSSSGGGSGSGGPSHNFPSPLGQRVHVGIPFRCDYGHRIQLQDDVTIESGCVIQDAKEVRISRGTYIGPNVQIISKTIPFAHSLHHHHQHLHQLHPHHGFPPPRSGPGGSPRGVVARGIPIHIGEGVVIGAGCIIAPDYDDKNGMLTIGAGAYIMPGTVVREDVKPNLIYGVSSRDGPQVLGDISTRAPPPPPQQQQHPSHNQHQQQSQMPPPLPPTSSSAPTPSHSHPLPPSSLPNTSSLPQPQQHPQNSSGTSNTNNPSMNPHGIGPPQPSSSGGSGGGIGLGVGIGSHNGGHHDGY